MVPSPRPNERIRREYDWAVDSPCFAVIDAIARYEGIETRRMADDLPVLRETLDPDALHTLLQSNQRATVSFRYAGYHIRITDESVAISQPGVHQLTV